jgi:hypothetical protein
MARTKGAKDKKPRKKRSTINVKAFNIDLTGTKTSYEYSKIRIASR